MTENIQPSSENNQTVEDLETKEFPEKLSEYKDIGPREKPSGFEENLTYGFGFNSLPPGQKNILIFGGLAFAAACFLSLYSLH